MVAALYKAAAAGVKVQLLIRGICCLLPSVHPNLSVVRLVDRYLEHARVMVFHNEGQPLIYMGSADWMERNFARRIEVVFPLKSTVLQNDILHMLHLQLADNTKAVRVEGDENIPVERASPAKSLRAQEATYEWLKHKK